MKRTFGCQNIKLLARSRKLFQHDGRNGEVASIAALPFCPRVNLCFSCRRAVQPNVLAASCRQESETQNMKVDMKLKKIKINKLNKLKQVKCAFVFGGCLSHVMVHCKHSRIAKAPSDQSHPKYGAPFPRKPPGVSFSPEGIFWWHTSLGRASLSRWESRSDSWTAMQQGRGLFLPFASLR